MNTYIMKTVDIESLFCYISSICSARILTVLRKELYADGFKERATESICSRKLSDLFAESIKR